MRRRFFSIRILLLLVPYWCFAVFGMLPHVHQGYGISFVPMACACAACLARQGMPALGVIDNCPLCQWQQASLVCSVSLPELALPCGVAFASPYKLVRMVPAALLQSSSRAPPFAAV